MPKTTTVLQTPLREQLDRLASCEPSGSPVLSLYLDLRADQHGRRTHADAFIRRVVTERGAKLNSEVRKSFDAVVERIRTYVESDVPPSVTGLAIFASTEPEGFFETVQLDAPIEQHALFVGSVPHLYPLAKVNDQYPRYAALVLDTNSARLFVFGLGRVESREEVTNPKTRRGAVGGWSQKRYQRHVDNVHLHHMKEVVAVLDRVVRDESIEKIVIACDDVARPILMEQLPKHLAAKVIDSVALDVNAPEHEVLNETLEALRQHDGVSDAERVQTMFDEWAAGGLGVTGTEATLDALAKQQVEELLITARAEDLKTPSRNPAGTLPGSTDVTTSSPGVDLDADRVHLAGQFVALAQQNSARIRFIEDSTLLAEVGGVGALLRFRIQPS
jgi:peptide chain release factor subunit 1